ncbi:hypothetical protein G6F31_016468 [Rhizopus arrhizus]|nr:hypothetical protein G6F31_016468 [Rhizopus arrhizus]
MQQPVDDFRTRARREPANPAARPPAAGNAAGCGAWATGPADSAGPGHSAGRAGSHPGCLRRPAGPAAVPDPQAELQCAGHPDGGCHAAVPLVCGPDPHHQPGAGRRVPADGGHADRDQVAHAAAGQEDRHRRRARRSARRAGPPPARIRSDEAGRP